MAMYDFIVKSENEKTTKALEKYQKFWTDKEDQYDGMKLLQENNPKITGELYGGKYWKIEDSGYVDDRWTETLTVRVYLQW